MRFVTYGYERRSMQLLKKGCTPPMVITLPQGRSGSSMLNNILQEHLRFEYFPLLSEFFGSNAVDKHPVATILYRGFIIPRKD